MKANRFRFRAWDGDRMLEVLELSSSGVCEVSPLECICGEDQGAGYTFDDEYGPCPKCGSGPISADMGDLILLQSTGLTDKRGREIFEGDIVECKLRPDDNECKTLLGAVYWWTDGWGVRGKAFENFMLGEVLSGAVVGNIYQNPELLKG